MTPQNGESYSLQSLETSFSPSSFAVSSVFLHETILGQEDFWPCVYCYIPLFPLSSSGCFASRSLPWFLFWNVQTKSLIELEMTRLARCAFGSLGLGTASCRQAVVTGAFEVSSICIPFGCTYISLAFGVLLFARLTHHCTAHTTGYYQYMFLDNCNHNMCCKCWFWCHSCQFPILSIE